MSAVLWFVIGIVIGIALGAMAIYYTVLWQAHGILVRIKNLVTDGIVKNIPVDIVEEIDALLERLSDKSQVIPKPRDPQDYEEGD